MKKDNNKFTYYLPIGISFGVGAAGILSLFPIKKLDNRNQVKIQKNNR